MPDDVREIAGVRARPGEVARGRLPVGSYPDGSEVQVPFLVAAGARPGPVLAIIAGIHGPEIPGVEVVRRLVQGGLELARLSGSLILVPVANPWGFHRQVMATPQDDLNLNRVFPGDPEGTTSQRLAHRVFEALVRPAYALVDLHANPEPALQFAIHPLLAQPTLSQVESVGWAMAEAYGVTTIGLPVAGGGRGYLFEAAAAVGIPGIAVELVAWRRIVPDAVESALKGLRNVLRHLGMYPGEREAQSVPRIEAKGLRRRVVTLARGGILEPLRMPGEPVGCGETIGLVRDAFGDVVEEVRSPVAGWVLAWPWVRSQALASGEIAAFLAYQDAEGESGR